MIILFDHFGQLLSACLSPLSPHSAKSRKLISANISLLYSQHKLISQTSTNIFHKILKIFCKNHKDIPHEMHVSDINYLCLNTMIRPHPTLFDFNLWRIWKYWLSSQNVDYHLKLTIIIWKDQKSSSFDCHCFSSLLERSQIILLGFCNYHFLNVFLSSSVDITWK